MKYANFYPWCKSVVTMLDEYKSFMPSHFSLYFFFFISLHHCQTQPTVLACWNQIASRTAGEPLRLFVYNGVWNTSTPEMTIRHSLKCLFGSQTKQTAVKSLVSLLSANLGPEVSSAARYLLQEARLSKCDCLLKKGLWHPTWHRAELKREVRSCWVQSLFMSSW